MFFLLNFVDLFILLLLFFLMFFWELSIFYCDCFLFFFLFLLNFLELFWTFISITSVHTLKRWSQANRPKTGFLVHYLPLVWMWSANWNATSTSSQMKHCRKSNREGSYQLGITVVRHVFDAGVLERIVFENPVYENRSIKHASCKEFARRFRRIHAQLWLYYDVI